MSDYKRENKMSQSKKEPVFCGPIIAYNQQGYTTPVFFDPHTAINAAGDKGSATNGTLITGAPGSGKSFLGMTLAMISAVCGKKTIFLDPKNDSLGMLNLKEWVNGKITQMDINDKELAGAMDPFIAQPTQNAKVAKAYSLLSILLGPFTEAQESILYPIVQDVAADSRASMTLLGTKLSRHANQSLNALGTRLAAIQGSSESSTLIFGKVGEGIPEIKPIQLNDGMTIISMLGLSLPDPNSDAEHQEPREKLGLGILYLITDYIMETMKNPDEKDVPKTIFIDEAWAIAATKMGYETMSSLLRLGRAFNTAVILMTQNVSDLESDTGENRLLNSVNTKFAFRCNDAEEAHHLCAALGISDGFADSFLNLSRGQCIMRDYKSRTATIKIIAQCDPIWPQAFETNPMKRAKNKAEAQKIMTDDGLGDFDNEDQ